MSDIYGTLAKFAADAELEIAACSADHLTLTVSLPSRGGAVWEIRCSAPIHLDLNPAMTLGRVRFGGLELLPDGYTDTRNFDYGGSVNYRVLEFTDVDDKLHYVVCDGEEEITTLGAG